MKTDWLDRSLIVGPYLTLVTSQAECDQAMKDIGCASVPFIKNDHSDATVHFALNGKGETCCIVCVRVPEGVNGVQIAAMLVHEAVHIWQDFRDRIGESAPSVEFEAYGIQAIAQRLMECYARKIRR